jgi:hypothetical protein
MASKNLDFSINNKTITVKADFEAKTVKVNEMFFNNLEDFIYYVNKLTDIAEELKEECGDEI